MTTARNFFTATEQKRIVDAIAEAESHTSGEIRLHLADVCKGDPLEEAKHLFTKLGMHQTAQRNGVLIFIAVLSHKVAIVGDDGVNAIAGQGFWDTIVSRLIEGFRAHRNAEAVAECIVECGKLLGTHFPRNADDRNELSNDISYH